jgi:hypothetical protein
MANDNNGLAASLVQLAPLVKGVIDRIKPVLDQPIIRFPYNSPNSNTLVVPAGARGFPFPGTDFQNSLEWPFEVVRIKFSNDDEHTFRDWRVVIQDQTFNQPWGKTQMMVDLLVEANTNAWYLDFPWIIRPKGGAVQVLVDNLDPVNPISVDINFQGYQLIPRV